MKMKPLRDRIVVRRAEDANEKTGSIIVPDSAKEKPQEGEVMAVGPGSRTPAGDLNPPGLRVGDRVLFGKYSGSEVTLDGNEYVIMREDEILGILAGDDPTKPK
jgi:chaperonin GroES